MDDILHESTPAIHRVPSQKHIIEPMVRCVNFFIFCITCSSGAFLYAGPIALSLAELTSVLLTYFLADAHALFRHTSWHDFVYIPQTSSEDVVLLSMLRSVASMMASALGGGRLQQKPYFFVSAFFAPCSFTLVLWKLSMFHRMYHHHTLLLLLLLHLFFAAFHALAAHKISTWTKRIWEHGLQGVSWDHRSQNQLLQETVRDLESGEVLELDHAIERLAEPNSQWLHCRHVPRLHYMVAHPKEGGEFFRSDEIIILIHGFGSGLFAWRNCMQPLADASKARVVAFDRPGFGLTSRPYDPTAYTLKFHAELALEIAVRLGGKRVVLCGFTDGALVALLAAASACHNVHTGLARGPPHSEIDTISAAEFVDAAWVGSLSVSKATLMQLKSGEWPSSITPSHSNFLEVPRPKTSNSEVLEAGDGCVVFPLPADSRSLDIQQPSSSSQMQPLQIDSLIMLHPDLTGSPGPAYLRPLKNSRLGRKIIARFLGTEVSHVANERLYGHHRPQADTIHLYERQLEIPGWETALVAVVCAENKIGNLERSNLISTVAQAGLPVCIFTGQYDPLCTPKVARGYAERFGEQAKYVTLPGVGHFSHEESPELVVDCVTGALRHRAGGSPNGNAERSGG